jgi:DNA-binding HxlR family transcriptional regulator
MSSKEAIQSRFMLQYNLRNMKEVGMNWQERDTFAQTTPSADTEKQHVACLQFQHTIEFIGRRWIGTILFVLMDGPARFNELLAAVPHLSDRLLTERLRELEAAKLVTREVLPGPPVKVVYELSAAGRDLYDILQSIAQWGYKWLPADTE